MPIRTKIRDLFSEGGTYFLSGQFLDEDGQPIGSLDEVTLTLYDRDSGDLLGGRAEGQSILNENGGTVDGQGNWRLELTPADNGMANPARGREVHIALVRATYDGGAKAVPPHEIEFTVVNLAKV